MWMFRLYYSKTLWLVLFILWTVLTIGLSLIPYTPGSKTGLSSGIRWDYLQHFFLYFTLGSLYIIWRSGKDFSIRNLELLAILIIIGVFSMGTEFIQKIVPGRAFNYIDLMYNFGGLLSSVLLVYLYLIRTYLKRRYSSIRQ
jgi:VanZ family protein